MILLTGAVQAQAPHPWLAVRGGDGCLESGALTVRVEGLLRLGAPPAGIAIALDAAGDTPRFSVWRAGELVGERAFPPLQGACPARLDAVALALALALESVGAGQVRLPASPPHGSASPPAPGPSPHPAAPPTARGHGNAPGAPATTPPTPPVAASKGLDTGVTSDVDRPTDPLAAPAQAPPAPSAQLEPPPPSASPLDEPGQPATAPSVSGTDGPTVHPAAFAAFGFLLGVQPQIALVAEVGGQLRIGALTWELAGLWSPQVATELSMGSGRVHSSVVGGSVRTCLGPLPRALEGSVCAGVTGGAMLGAGQGFDRDRRATSGWLAASVGGRLGVPLTRALALGVRVDALLNVVRPVLRVQGSGGDEARAAIVGLQAQVALTWTPP